VLPVFDSSVFGSFAAELSDTLPAFCPPHHAKHAANIISAHSTEISLIDTFLILLPPVVF